MLTKFICFLCLFFSLNLDAQCNPAKVYISDTQKAHEIRAQIISSDGAVEYANMFRLYLRNEIEEWIDVSSVHGDDVGIYFYEKDIRNRSEKAWAFEFKLIYKCSLCGTFQDNMVPPCINPNCLHHRPMGSCMDPNK